MPEPVPSALLDASVLISPPQDLAAIASRVVVSTISMAELASGLSIPSDPVERARREERYHQLLTTYTPLPYSVTAARLYGSLCEALRSAGRSARPRRFDLLLASVAGDLGVPILTRNARDFEGIHDIVRTIAI